MELVETAIRRRPLPPKRKSLKRMAVDRYFRLARTTAAVRHIHNRLCRWQNNWRYGINSAFMFRNLEMEVNSMCNRTCSYCPNVSAKRPAGYMEESLFRKIIHDLAEIDFDGNVSYHFYGEPLLDKRLPGFVEYTSRHLPKSSTVIYSNGDFLTLEVLREYIRCGVGIFWVTQHDNRMPPHLQRIQDEATAEEKKHVHIHFANAIHITNRSGLITTVTAPVQPLRAPCDWPIATMVITMNGNVVPCCNDYFETEVVGNVTDRSVAEVWCSEEFERFRRALSKGDRTASRLCMGCDYIPDMSSLRRIVPV